jgi:D-alanyl-D-alanine carboxypeptidase
MRSTDWRRRARVLAAALVVGGSLLVGSLGSATRVLGVGPLPACKIQDVLTAPRGYDDWATTLVDWNLSVGPDYKPPDLVSVRQGGVGGGGLVRALAIPDLKALAAGAANNGTPLVAFSPYRPYTQQVKLFNGYAGWNGTKYTNFDNAINFSARPGHSEHQLGTTIDFVAVGDSGLTSNWEVTPTGGWMARNAWKYGWLMSYPKGKQDVVCYSYEPWHYRYYGRELARKIHDSGLTTREYLWANFTQIDGVTWQQLASPTSTPTAPAASPGSAPTPAPTTGPTAAGTAAPSAVATLAPAVDDAGRGSSVMFVGAVVLLLALFGGLAGWVVLQRRPRRR